MKPDEAVDAYASTYGDADSASRPSSETSATPVVRDQMTENTGRHLLDSGSHYGRHWEENQETPPWERPRYEVNTEWVTESAYHFMTDRYARDRSCVELEVGLYAFAYHGPGEGDSWMHCMEEYADLLGTQEGVRVLTDAGLTPGVADACIYAGGPDTTDSVTVNTYNSEFGTLSQCLQFTTFGGLHAEYAAVQVHGGCDIRGGYTAPRVYSSGYDAWMTHERSYYCPHCQSSEPESCLRRGDEEFVHVPDLTRVSLQDRLDECDYDPYDAALSEVLHSGHGDTETQGAVVHLCGDGELGLARF